MINTQPKKGNLPAECLLLAEIRSARASKIVVTLNRYDRPQVGWNLSIQKWELGFSPDTYDKWFPTEVIVNLKPASLDALIKALQSAQAEVENREAKYRNDIPLQTLQGNS